MKKSTKAALLSGLIFPGLGHLLLKLHLRGSIILITALVAFAVVLTRAVQRALSIVDQIKEGDIPIDPGAITEMISSSSSGGDSFIETIAMIVLGLCWIFGIIDSYRLGVAQDKQD